MATYYAWSPVKGAVHNSSGEVVNVKVGEEVSQDSLGVSDDDWQYLVDSGAVRTQKYPVAPDSPLSPVEHVKQQAAAMMEGGFVPPEEEESISEETNRFA